MRASQNFQNYIVRAPNPWYYLAGDHTDDWSMMSTPKVALPVDLASLCVEIGRRRYDEALAAIPAEVRGLLDDDKSKSINEKTAIANTNEWRDGHNLPLGRLAKLASETLKEFQSHNPEAQKVFRQKLTSSEYVDVDRFLSANEVPQKYLVDMIATYVDDPKQFPKLLALLVKLGEQS